MCIPKCHVLSLNQLHPKWAKINGLLCIPRWLVVQLESGKLGVARLLQIFFFVR